MGYLGYLDWPTAILTLAALGLRTLMIAGIVRLDVPGRLVAALTLLYIGFYPIDYLYISKGFLPAAVHLIFFLGSVKILTAKTRRDFMFVKAIAVMALLAAAVLSISLTFFAFSDGILLFTIATLQRRSGALDAPIFRYGIRARNSSRFRAAGCVHFPGVWQCFLSDCSEGFWC